MPRRQKAPLRQLTTTEREALEQVARASRERADRVARAKILLAVADGARFTDAARYVGRRSGDAVARLVARWNDEGIAALEARRVGPVPHLKSLATPGPAVTLADFAPAMARPATLSLVTPDPPPGRLLRSANLTATLREALELDGTLAVVLVDLESGMILGAVHQPGVATFDLDVAAAGNTEVVRAKLATIRELGLTSTIEDILITLSDQYHLIRPLGSDPGVFLYMVLERAGAHLGLARRGLSQIEAGLVV